MYIDSYMDRVVYAHKKIFEIRSSLTISPLDITMISNRGRHADGK
jgi:hypothetical protein